MKVPAAALASLLLMSICSSAEVHHGDSSVAASPQKPDTPIACCFSYIGHRLPHYLITSAYMTSSQCSQPAVILVTKTGREICTDPEARWVQEHLKHFQKPEY
ncbi:C-C motif chemokine 3-like [Pelecanus crispus]|uniref:C-C motif chemokine 3-like n=1 Tax=Pelecanus crispus TaxID=36300 RepID=UPI0005113FDD|nr:PREDICTED: C-C motif chemokine 3-like [Pelecanus crispus]